MFILSKIFWLIFQPLALAFLSALAALCFLALGETVLAAVFCGLCALTLAITCFTSLGAMMMAKLENRFARPMLQTAPDYAIVLGGGINTGISARRGSYVFSRAADRYIEALRLARLYPGMKILVTGGDNSLSGNIHGEAAPAARFFNDHGIGKERLIYEPVARNTAENAHLTAALMRERKLMGTTLLVTSAYHMPRALALFQRQNIAVTPWPCDYRTDGKASFSIRFDMPMHNATMFSTALRERAGLMRSEITGRVAAPLD